MALVLACLPVLVAEPLAPEHQPPPDALSYLTAGRSLAAGAYEVDVEGISSTPRYPPGLPLLLAPAAKFGTYPYALQAVSMFISVGLVVAGWLAARKMAGDTAAIATAVLLGLSPFPAATGRVVMSDALAATATVLALLALLHSRRVLSGLLLGYSAVVRLACAVGVLGLVAIRARQAVVAAGAVLLALGVFQWAAMGSPTGGYDEGTAQFSTRYVLATDSIGDGDFYAADDLWERPNQVEADGTVTLPNVAYYPKMLLWDWAFLPPGVALVGMFEMWRRRHTEAGRWSIVVAGSNVAMFLGYWFQSGRFVAPAGMLLTVFAGVGIARLAGQGAAVTANTSAPAVPAVVPPIRVVTVPEPTPTR